MKKALVPVLLLALSLFGLQTYAQPEMPAASPTAMASQVVGFTKIQIDYSSPAVKGRKVFGELVPFGQVWRAGANAPTKISFSTAVKIGDKNLRPGEYSIFITPAQNGKWAVHFNSKGNSVYAYMKDGKIDMDDLTADLAATVTVDAAKTAMPFERMVYFISAEDNKTAKVTMAWENTMISFMIDTQAEQMMKRMESAF